MEQAFKKAVEESTKKDKDAIRAVMFGGNAGAQIAPRTIKQAPKEGNVPREEIEKAVETVSKSQEKRIEAQKKSE